MLKICCLTHADFEGPGLIESWAQDRKISFKVIRPYGGESLPDVSAFDILIVMGGPQGANDALPYLDAEKALIQKALEHNKGILGFCLGAQLIGAALGAPAMRSPEKEVGIFPITLTDDGKKNVVFHDFPEEFQVIHWHNDMIGLPSGAVVLAQSPGCPRQIIQFAPRVYGFQCHLEITQEGILDLMKAAPGDLTPSLFTQKKEDLLKTPLESIHNKLFSILDRFIQL